MALSDKDILAAIRQGRIKIDPLPDLDVALEGVSIDCRLDNVFQVPERSRLSHIDATKPESINDIMRTIEVADGEPFIMQPGEFAWAQTLESLELPDDLAARLEGRARYSRAGITISVTAPLFAPGWKGKGKIELTNRNMIAVALYPGEKICSFMFQEVSSPVLVPYQARGNSK